ncbi:hypothetical protein FRC04_002074 [Tulasnella sp. 424]|nr:hypothetical protein FRC04_002074 [Tulasnella sp. 424]
MAPTKRRAEGPTGEEPPTKKTKVTDSDEACPYDNIACAHGRAAHHATVVGPTYGVHQGVAVRCDRCDALCKFELFSGPDAVPQPEFTADDDLVVGEEDGIVEPPLGVLFLGDSRRASRINDPDTYP